MANRTTGAQRHNARMNKIFSEAEVNKAKYPEVRCNFCDDHFTIHKDENNIFVSNHRCI